MTTHRLTAREWIERIVLALLFTGFGSLIIIVFSPWTPKLDNKLYDYLGRISISILLLVLTLLVRKSPRFNKYWLVFFGLFVLSAAVTADRIFSIYLLDFLGVSASKPASIALTKLNECAAVVFVIILCTKASTASLGSIYLQKGNLKQGLMIGLIAFLFFAATSVPIASLMFKGTNLTFARILPWIPWILIFVLANGFLEELLFRGLFLRKLEPFYGKFLSNFLIAFVFTILHKGASYNASGYLFLLVLFPLALACGYLAQKTNALWASTLLHAGMDISVALSIFSNL